MQVNNLAYRLPERQLFSNISFNTVDTPLIIIEGQNGSGKSTLLKVILGLLSPNQGRVIGGEKIGYVPDSSSQYFIGMTPRLLFHFLQEQFSLDKATCHLLLADLQDKFSFRANLLDKKIQDLSLGEKKKVFLMAAWIQSPKLFVMDEPFSGLDEDSLIHLKGLIEAGLSAGQQFIIVTHDYKNLLDGPAHVISL